MECGLDSCARPREPHRSRNPRDELLKSAECHNPATLLDGELPGQRFDRNSADRQQSGRREPVEKDNLTDQRFAYATLQAHFTGAEVRGGKSSQGMPSVARADAAAQLYSTASYQAHDLTGIGLYGNNLAGANLAGQNLTNANFADATLTARTSPGPMCGGQISLEPMAELGSLRPTLLDGQLPGPRFDRNRLGRQQPCRREPRRPEPHERGLLRSAFLRLLQRGANLTGANLSQANLTNANFAGYYDETVLRYRLAGRLPALTSPTRT